MTVQQGTPFVDFSLGSLDTEIARKKGPLLVFFWRTGCSTCRFTIPFFDRLASAYPAATIVGVSQDDVDATEAYCSTEGIRMPQVIDLDLAATRAYGLTTVPSYVLTDKEGIALEAGQGWDRELAETIGRRIADALGVPVAPIVAEKGAVVAFKPG